MNIKFYPPNDGGFSVKQITTGQMWVFADVTCPFCGKEQPVAATHYIGGPCIRCGKRTDGSEQ